MSRNTPIVQVISGNPRVFAGLATNLGPYPMLRGDWDRLKKQMSEEKTVEEYEMEEAMKEVNAIAPGWEE